MIKITFNHPRNKQISSSLIPEKNPSFCSDLPIIIFKSCMDRHPFAIFTHLMQKVDSLLSPEDIFCINITDETTGHNISTPTEKTGISQTETLIYEAMDCGFSLLKKETTSSEAVLYFMKNSLENELILE